MAGTHANEGCKLGAKDMQVPSAQYIYQWYLAPQIVTKQPT